MWAKSKIENGGIDFILDHVLIYGMASSVSCFLIFHLGSGLLVEIGGRVFIIVIFSLLLFKKKYNESL